MSTIGLNSAYINELYYEYLKNPEAFDESWRSFFAFYTPSAQGIPSATDEQEVSETLVLPPPPVQISPKPNSENGNDVSTPQKTEPIPEGAKALAGAPLRVAQNMEQSLHVPTATSFREIPVKLLEENRTLINGYLKASDNGKVSYTHIIGWAIVQSMISFPSLNNEYREINGKPHLIVRPDVNLGLAIDLQRSDGSRALVVPSIKGANGMDFRQFYNTYETLVTKARTNKLSPDDFAGTTVTLTNPGTIGTVASVPRLMSGQGTIIATGGINYPAAYLGMDVETLSDLGISKIMEVTSTYDHRIIQGAESGMFLARLQDLLMGKDGFYDEIFKSLEIPYKALNWQTDAQKGLFRKDPVAMAVKQQGVATMINNYRVRGHLLAHLDPLGYEPQYHPDLDPASYGLTIWDFDRQFVTSGVAGIKQANLRTILSILRDTYTQRIGVEFMHIQDPEPKNWLRDTMENNRNRAEFSNEKKRKILLSLSQAEGFEKFLQTKYTGHKRFSLEGSETLIPMLAELVVRAAKFGTQRIIMGMAHRGRLNTFATIVGKDPTRIFSEFEDTVDPDSVQGSGDVKYHLGYHEIAKTDDGNQVEIWVAPNPSHLEAVNPVVEGMTRAAQDRERENGTDLFLPVLVHGDAAFAGQGVVAETFNMSQLAGYTTGGTIHLVIDNQIGFTAAPRDTRSMIYSTDIARMVQAPIFHVNGDDPEAAAYVMGLAFEFRNTFKRDVVVDLVCYRRYGHNETDEPMYTNPMLYRKIKNHPSTRVVYTGRLLRNGTLTMQDVESMEEEFKQRLEGRLQEVKSKDVPVLPDNPLEDQQINPASIWGNPDTGTSEDNLKTIIETLSSVPDSFNIHPKLKTLISKRPHHVEEGSINWAFAEQIAFGSLLLDGYPVRLTGQDSQRGTFSQRHAVLHDQINDTRYIPLNHLSDNQATLHIYDSPLSEYAVVGFEYGYSVTNPDTLVLWEAQFGDFVNGAQIPIDQFISSGEDKWGQTSGLVLLLPHGFEGQGPEHSSARLERFLTLCAEDNMQVVYPSTPAQYYHVLRRQLKRSIRKPLIVMTPKSLLRHPSVVSSLDEFKSGTFQLLIPETGTTSREQVRRVLLCSGKIYYDLIHTREQLSVEDVHVIRIEQLYPFPTEELERELSLYPVLKEVIWVQEEPRNMGAWTWINDMISPVLRSHHSLGFIGRPASGSPAAGSARHHAHEQAEILKRAFTKD